MTASDHDARMLTRAARLALRGHGGAEPNPMVGCIIATSDGTIVGDGYHRQCGGPHAEAAALRSAGDRATGATAYVTLEPCSHVGRTPPCAQALIDAGIRRVVIARRDPNPEAAGGASVLEAAGVDVVFREDVEVAVRVSDPFVHRVRTKRPYVVMKWAQTVDGRVATRSGDSQWISGPRSRRLVHRERGRVDAIMTGIGTVLADDPQLTARDGRRRRLARRVVIDPKLQMPLTARLVTDQPALTTIACHASILDAGSPAALELEARGVELVGIPMDGTDLPLAPVLRHLVDTHTVATVLVEAGAGLMSRLLAQGLVNEAWVFQGPLVLGDAEAMPALRGRVAERLTDGIDLDLIGVHRRQDDVLLRYRLPTAR